MKIKIFTGIKLGELENEVNEFMANRNVVTLMQSEVVVEGVWSLTITVVYK